MNYSILGSILGSPYLGKLPILFGFGVQGLGLGFKIYGLGEFHGFFEA